MAVTFVKYESRKLFTEMERLRLQRDELAVDWGRLQLELATWGEQGRIKETAIQRLQMQVPQVADIVVVRP
jgi:cell division protein FtsL